MKKCSSVDVIYFSTCSVTTYQQWSVLSQSKVIELEKRVQKTERRGENTQSPLVAQLEETVKKLQHAEDEKQTLQVLTT